MKIIFRNPHAYIPTMAGLLAGIIATILNMFYDIIYRQTTGFSLSMIINVASIIFVTLFVLVVAGLVYALMDKYVKRVQLIYIIVFVVLTLLGLQLALHTHRSPDPLLTSEFRGLLSGIVVISGASAAFLIPYFAKNETTFM